MADTVLVTGASGFVAKYVTADLLKAGYAVRGTVRSLGRTDGVRESLTRLGADPSNLSFCEADLTAEDGWDAALEGVRYVQHIASPFPMAQPRDREALVPAARDGCQCRAGGYDVVHRRHDVPGQPISRTPLRRKRLDRP